MEPHTHPPYEETFTRIATILDVIAGSQAEHADAMAELRQIQIGQARALEETRSILARHARALEDTRTQHAKALIDQDAAYARLMAAMEKLTLKSAETEDKLNALIALMDQHLDDHRRPS
jgi:hypothetical protein